ncbi:MAG TPA: TnsA-like heteromeric transposase endonuclease subunit [Mycobacterium sp.]|jgi:hypothetical protein|nr:TnsA-like heteromeric transposase endonuclease subunit [Mycobacterium sp.]
MSVGVDVDLGSAVMSYRPAAGEERSLPAQRVSAAALFECVPWRTFRWYFGQRHYSGTWWSSTMCDHVIYESRLELSRLLLADFDPCVRQMIAQPFMVTATVDGQPRRHILDYLWATIDGPVVVDVVRAERLNHPGVALLCQWTRDVVESLAWGYQVLSEPPPTRLESVRFLAGYRRNWLIHPEILEEMRSRTTDLVGMSIADAEREFAYPSSLVRPALMHLLWCHELEVDLDRPLRPSRILEAPR